MKTDTLDKNITRFVKRFGVKRAILYNEFCYDYITERIGYTIFDNSKSLLNIMYINEKYGVDIEPYSFIFPILHEIGHHVTANQVDFDIEIYLRGILELEEDFSEWVKAYYNLPAEQLANEWAIDYLMKHQEECQKLQNKWYKIIYHIYKKNNFFEKIY